ERRAPPARARLPARAARRALRFRRGRLGRCRPRPRHGLLPRGRAGTRPRAALGRRALVWHDLLLDTGLEAEEALPALWDLVWAGEVTNDAWTPLRAARRNATRSGTRSQRPRRFSRRRAGE